MTKALGEENLDVIEVGNCHLPHAGGEHLNLQKEAVNFHQHSKGSTCKIYEVGGEASSATLTIKVVDMINKEEDGNATSVFLQDRAQFYGDKSTKIDLDTSIIPRVAADNPKCNFNEVLGIMLHSDEQEIDLFDDQRGTSLRPDQKVPAILLNMVKARLMTQVHAEAANKIAAVMYSGVTATVRQILKEEGLVRFKTELI